MPTYLQEAALLAAETSCNLCPATDAFEVLDAHLEIRLALKDTWTDEYWSVYREVPPADRISRWAGPRARARKPEKTYGALVEIGEQFGLPFRGHPGPK